MLKESDAVEWKRGRRRRSRAKENLEERPQRQDPDSSCFHTRTGTDCPAMCPAEITERETKRTTNTSLEPQMEKLQAECTTRLRLLTTVRPRSTAFEPNVQPHNRTLSATFCLLPRTTTATCTYTPLTVVLSQLCLIATFFSVPRSYVDLVPRELAHGPSLFRPPRITTQFGVHEGQNPSTKTEPPPAGSCTPWQPTKIGFYVSVAFSWGWNFAAKILRLVPRPEYPETLIARPTLST